MHAVRHRIVHYQRDHHDQRSFAGARAGARTGAVCNIHEHLCGHAQSPGRGCSAHAVTALWQKDPRSHNAHTSQRRSTTGVTIGSAASGAASRAAATCASTAADATTTACSAAASANASAATCEHGAERF